ncbi:hypothetical protein HMPREF0762_01913 [Slackia exigua ATCC 700122]|uniref:Uncharacterized protein n=1 Tax=Slackia exigua (strain ATCC 700122 / DSM 15923 / CIP 105133 / JCM 11022 / KCTC 5966 / S-7) TaxID=649764 RepID=D0WJ87_SLAES|nr:hypothetical protein HMPREF0762_01913 [Slackia exigua ATCC 700122]
MVHPAAPSSHCMRARGSANRQTLQTAHAHHALRGLLHNTTETVARYA